MLLRKKSNPLPDQGMRFWLCDMQPHISGSTTQVSPQSHIKYLEIVGFDSREEYIEYYEQRSRECDNQTKHIARKSQCLL